MMYLKWSNLCYMIIIQQIFLMMYALFLLFIHFKLKLTPLHWAAKRNYKELAELLI